MIYRDEPCKIEGIWNKVNKFTSNRQIVIYGDSLPDAVQFIESTGNKWGREDSKAHNGDSWTLGADYAKALTLANEGWQEGVEMIDAALHAIIPAAGREARWGWGVAGGSVSVGRYLTGHPKAMRNRRKRASGSAPVLHIVLNAVASCAVNASQMANYGAAITGLVDRLENTGRRVHLDIVMVTKANNIRLSVGWNIKRASESVDLSQIAFSLAHPAAFRRIGFAMMERSDKAALTSGYGYCADAKPCDVPDWEDGTMIIDGVNHAPSRCNDPKDALRLAIEQVNKAAVLAGHATPDSPLIPEDEELFAY